MLHPLELEPSNGPPGTVVANANAAGSRTALWCGARGQAAKAEGQAQAVIQRASLPSAARGWKAH